MEERYRIIDEPTWRCQQNPFIGALGIQEPVILGEPQIFWKKLVKILNEKGNRLKDKTKENIERIKEKSLKRREKRSDNNPPLKEKN